MSNWIGLGFLLLLVAGAIWGLSALGKPRRLTVEEFERRASEGTGLAGAGLLSLQKALDPAAERAVETQQDFKRGSYDKKQETGEDNE
ncbi:MAG: hypothetical protein ABIP75_19255 [Pyrinomonadaceae bacterium]